MVKFNGKVIIKIIYSLLIFAIIAHIVLLAYNPDGIQMDLYFGRMYDQFADFLNVVRYSADRNPYYYNPNGDPERAYLPICYLITYPFSLFSYAFRGSLQDCQKDRVALFSTFVYLLISTGLLFVSLEKICEKNNISKKNVYPLLLSGVFLFSIERANLIILTCALISLFLAYYDSNDNNQRMIASFSLAMASAIKVYPVFFGILYIRKKQWKDALVSTVMCLVIVFIPFNYFEGGLSSLKQLLINLKISSEIYGNPQNLTIRFGINYVVYDFLYNIGVSDSIALSYSVLSFRLIRVLSVIALVLSIFVDDETLSLEFIFYSILFFPDNSQLYNALYILPIFLIIVNRYLTDDTYSNWRLIAYLMLLSPLQYVFKETKWLLIDYVFIAVFFITIMIEIIKLFRKDKYNVSVRRYGSF